MCERAMKVTVHIRGYVFGMAFFMLSAIPVFAQIYQYRDKNGQLHFTNELSEIPENQQPKVLMKQPNRPSEQKKAEDHSPGQDLPETEKGTDPASETPKAEDGENPREIPIVEDLNKKKATLEKTHTRLMVRKKALQKEKQTLKTPEQVREYQKKVTRLNHEIDSYKKRNQAFQKKADAYNEAVREKGE